MSSIKWLTKTDAYKLDHRRQYELAGKVTEVYSNYTNRKSRVEGVTSVVHFGLQAYLHQLMKDSREFFEADEGDVVSSYYQLLTRVLGPDAAKAIGTEHVRDLHRLGYVPLEFRAVPEGTLVPIRVPSFTVHNTHPDFFWLTNYLETPISANVWQPSTSATLANEFRKVLERGALRTGGSLEAIDWQGHDFSYRGMSSDESAAASGAGHLLSFTGTDSLVALPWIDEYYGGEYVAGSVAATEHSVMCTGIATGADAREYEYLQNVRGHQEYKLFDKLLDLYPSGILSVVSDTFDLWHVLTEILPSLKSKVLARDGKLVIRPDSGDPVDIICGDDLASGPAERGVVQLLWDIFGGTVNEAGFKELDPHIGAIYGDSITPERAHKIYRRLAEKGFASTNVVFGIGSYHYQYVTRDTFGSAMKATHAVVDGKGVNLFKDPITDDGTKKSATGYLAVIRDHGELVLVEKAREGELAASVLQPTWRDGEFLVHQSFSDVRAVLAEERARVVRTSS